MRSYTNHWEGTFYNKFNFKFITTNFRWAFKVWLLPGIIPCYPARPPGHAPITFRLPPFHPHGFFARQSNLSIVFPPPGYCTYCSLCPKCFSPIFSWVASPLLQICAQMLTSQWGLFCFSYLKYSSPYTSSLIYGFQNIMLCILLLLIICFVTYVPAGTFVCFVPGYIVPA